MERDKRTIEIPQDTNFVIIDFIHKSRKTGIPVLNPDMGLYISVIQTSEKDGPFGKKIPMGRVFVPTLIEESGSDTQNVAIQYTNEFNFNEIYCYIQDLIYKWYSKKTGKLEVIVADFINSSDAEISDLQRLPFNNDEEKRRREIRRTLRRKSQIADIGSILKVINIEQMKEKAALN